MESGDWPEVSLALKERRHELTLTGTEINERLTSGKLDKRIFDLVDLNFLEIANSNLEEIPEEISTLINLKNLALQGNKLKVLPNSFYSLSNLSFLDVSNNLLNALPASISECKKIHSLNVGSNRLTSISVIQGLHQLSILYIDNNQLTEIPEELCGLMHLSELYASKNKIKTLPSKVGNLKSLKVLDFSDNCLTEIPSELSECSKIKDLKLQNNPLKDNRLKKMALQCSTKAVMTYIAQDGPKGKVKGKKGKKKQDKGKASISDDEEEEEHHRRIIIHLHTDQKKKVVKKALVKDIRPHITCVIVKGLDLTDEAVFKSFIKLQTKLHDGLCEGRTVATIATHSLSSTKLPLIYDVEAPNDLKIKPLGKDQIHTGEELVKKLHEEKETERQKKKRQVKTGLFKYLDLLDGQAMYASLKDETGTVISFPPITNSEDTKIKNTLEDVLIEVTSPATLPKCRMVLESLIREMFLAGFESKTMTDGILKSTGLELEQIRIVDEEGNLQNVFPSNLDLDFGDAIPVERK